MLCSNINIEQGLVNGVVNIINEIVGRNCWHSEIYFTVITSTILTFHLFESTLVNMKFIQ